MFQQMAYTSSIIWHFVRGTGNDDQGKVSNSFETVVSRILISSDQGKLLVRPPERDEFHFRRFFLESSATYNPDENDLSAEDTEHLELLEPRSICFADIPIHNLPIHINRYLGIGLGFRRDILISRLEDLKPVDYFPKKNLFSLEHSTENYIPGKKKYILKNYSKIPTSEESFAEIYSEREWRTMRDLEFNASDLAVIFVPTTETMKKAIDNAKIISLIRAGVGIICGQDLYEKNKAAE